MTNFWWTQWLETCASPHYTNTVFCFVSFKNSPHCTAISYITDFDVDSVRRFRASWPNKNIAARKKLEAFRAFFRFVHESGWIPTNPTTPLKPPKITEPPTAPFTKEEVRSILDACDISINTPIRKSPPY